MGKVDALRIGVAWMGVMLSADVSAWENSPEFQSLNEAEAASFEGPSTLDSEYFASSLTYQLDSEAHYRWFSKQKALHINFGSLNTRRFMMGNRLKIVQPIFEHFELRLHYFDEEDFERQSTHLVLEMIFWPMRNLGWVLYGEPSFRKPNDDTGLALLIRPQDRHEIRLFNTFVDVTRLKYPDSPDTFVEPDLPYARGLVGRMWNPYEDEKPGDFFEYVLRYETPTRWKFIGQNYQYFYWRGVASAYGRKRIWSKLSASLRIEWDRKHEERTATGVTESALGDWDTDRFTTLAETTAYSLGPSQDWDLSLGLEKVFRKWSTNLGTGIYRDFIPYARIQFPAWGDPPASDHWILGYMLNWHREAGPEEIGVVLGHQESWEHRLNVGYEFSLGDQGSLGLSASADLDELGTRRSWEGGCGKLQLYF